MRLVESLKARARELKSEVYALYLAARHPGTPWYAKLYLVAIVAYALSPIDLIPDFIPVIGFLDEIVLLPFALVLAVKLVPESVMAECRSRATQQQPNGAWLGRIGALFIGLLWLALIVLAATLAFYPSPARADEVDEEAAAIQRAVPAGTDFEKVPDGMKRLGFVCSREAWPYRDLYGRPREMAHFICVHEEPFLLVCKRRTRAIAIQERGRVVNVIVNVGRFCFGR